ncbi:hypothetical protein OAO87_01955 [bacterium]|nr:hypothetical protein [bacterium]
MGSRACSPTSLASSTSSCTLLCGLKKELTQSARIKKLCGEHCVYDEVVHTETLEDDWADLLRRYPGLPQVRLPTINDSGEGMGDHPWGPPPPTEYTPELIRIVLQLEGWVFARFGYEMYPAT